MKLLGFVDNSRFVKMTRMSTTCSFIIPGRIADSPGRKAYSCAARIAGAYKNIQNIRLCLTNVDMKIRSCMFHGCEQRVKSDE